MIPTVFDKFLFSTAGIAAYPPGATFGPKVLFDFEFLWIITGSARCRFDGQVFDAPTDTVLLGRPGMTHEYDWDTRQRTLHAFFHFSFDYSEGDWMPLSSWPILRPMSADDLLRPLFRYVIGLAQSNVPNKEVLLEPAVLLMLRSFRTGYSAVLLSPHQDLPAAVQMALFAIRESLIRNPVPPITLANLAKAAHVSPEYLCRLFRRHLHMGPMQCAGFARLERAAAMLIRSNLLINEIADAVGFASPYHFSSKFRQVYGVPPREYRWAMQSGFMIQGNPIIQQLQLHAPLTPIGNR
ncbi:MAG: AraC family transcriptional regulator [Phycisphaeraceae bacterium]|nr:AraC family transcriptional regulator [Phycisphaeraceae bacterium]